MIIAGFVKQFDSEENVYRPCLLVNERLLCSWQGDDSMLMEVLDAKIKLVWRHFMIWRIGQFLVAKKRLFEEIEKLRKREIEPVDDNSYRFLMLDDEIEIEEMFIPISL